MKLQAVDLRCDDRRDPLGVESNSPRLSWVCQSTKRCEQQIAYQILVASDPEYLSEDSADFWDSGRVDSSDSHGILYEGKPLSSMARLFWTVRVWGRDGRESSWAAPSHWVMGILTPREWAAGWIGAISDDDARLPRERHYHLHPRHQADDPWEQVPPLATASILLRKEIFVSEGVTRATIFICGLGAFELSVNGVRLGDDFLSPAWTDYDRRCSYLTYDVTNQVQSGSNALGVILGNSMYNVAGGRYSKFLVSFGPPKMILQMALEYEDGRLEMFMSDSSWHWKRSPITFNCIFGGEDYDARLEEPEWDQVGSPLKGWQTVKLVNAPKGKLVSERIEPRRVLRSLTPVMVTEPAAGVLVYDLGENFAGRMRISVSGDRGSSVHMLPGELIDHRGFVTQKNLTSGREETIEFQYVLQGKTGKETWSPRFSYTGFRYLQIATHAASTGGTKPILHEVTGEVIGLAVDRAGTFSCSCDRLRNIYNLISRAMISNLQSIVTDCPHREKLGWLEVMHLMGPSLIYEFDLRTFLPKAIVDMRDAQLENGLIPDIAPEYVVFADGFRDSPEWGAAGILVPWLYYQHYHHLQPLKKHYAAMRKYLSYLGERSQDGIVSHGLGDWYDFGSERPGPSQLTSNGITATAIYYECLVTVARIARLLDRDDEADDLLQMAHTVQKRFNETYYHKNQASYDLNSQTANAMPIVEGLVPAEFEDSVKDHLLSDIRSREYQITAGDVGHVYVLRALMLLNRHEEALRAIRRDKGSGYLYQLAMGASTLTEAWDASKDSSQNHMMLGHAMEWFYAVLGGLRFDERFPAQHQFIVSPEPVADIEWASVHHNTIYGAIQIMWTLQDGVFSLELTVPVNTSALVYLPVESPRFVKESGISVYEIPGSRYLSTENGKSVFEIQSGTYEFSMDWHEK